jgi:putative peptide zinc metalloprotease protein
MRCSEELEARHYDNQVVVTCGGVEHLSLTSDEYELLISLDGRRTLHDLSSVYGPDVVELLDDFRSSGLLEGAVAPRERAIAFTENGIEFGGFGRFIEALHGAGGRHLLGGVFTVVATFAIIVGLVSLVTRGQQVIGNQSAEFSPAATLLILTVLGFCLAIVHESAHALVTHHFGRRVGPAGFGLYWGALTFFVDSTDALLLPKWRRIVQAVSGPVADAVVAASLTVFAIWIAAPGPWRTLLMQLAVLTWLEVLMNLVPLLELDGYWALSDALNRPHLRAESFAAMRAVLSGDTLLPTLRLATYGIASALFGLSVVALTVWAWIFIYLPLVRSSLGQGWIGVFASMMFVGPVIAGLVVATPGAVAAIARRVAAAIPRIPVGNRDPEGGEPK